MMLSVRISFFWIRISTYQKQTALWKGAVSGLESTNSVIEWPSMRKQVLRGLLTYVRLFDVVE